MFNADFYPTPANVIQKMVEGLDLKDKIILEPSAGSGAIVEYLQGLGATVISCEKDENLKLIIKSKCKHIADDFLTVTSDQISHINFIIMNPPFSRGAEHLIHAYNIAPKGCKIVCLLNSQTLKNYYSQTRKELNAIIESYGQVINLGSCFEEADRKTAVEVDMVIIQKEGQSYTAEFEGFFTDEEPEEHQEIGMMQYNVVRDLVNRYVAAVKLYDEQLEVGKRMNALLSGFYGNDLAFNCTENGAIKLRNEFKTDLQKSGWNFIFSKMNMQKYATRGLKEDINKFVEERKNLPFTMRNIYHMIDIVIGTQSQRMDKAILEAFDAITAHHADNRYNVKGWKTNSHFLVGKKFILPNCVSPAKEYGYTNSSYRYLSSYKSETIADLEKALCFVTASNYDEITPINRAINNNLYGEYYDNSEFFKYKAFKNGNMHFEFKSEEVWALFNQKIAKIKGFPLFEGKEQTKYQQRQTGRAYQQKANPAHAYKPTVLFEI